MKIRLAMCALMLMFACTCVWAADSQDLPVVKPRVRTVAVFKNGLGFVFRSGMTGLKDGWAMINELPAASLGALWIGTADTKARVSEVISCKCTNESTADPMNLGELLEANVGKVVGITYTGSEGAATKIHGTILSVPKDRPVDAKNPATVPLNIGRSYYDYWGYSSYYRNGAPMPMEQANRAQIVMVKTDNNMIVAINKSDIRALELPEDAQLKATLSRDVNGAKVHVAGNPQSAEVTLAYLEKGVTWSPSYLIDIKDPKMASITLEGVLTNDVEDLEDTTVSFVVGYPSFAYSDVNTPLLIEQSVGSFVRALETAENNSANAYYRGSMSNVMSQSVMYNSANYNDTNAASGSSYTTSQPGAGEGHEDLFFYDQEHVTLKKGDRARYTLFNTQVPYEHVYLWEVPDSYGVDVWGYRRSSDSNRREQIEQVWHAIMLSNTAKVPWTTAPAFTMNGSAPVAQDVLRYTPPTAKNTVKLTVATDVRARQTLTEVSRRATTLHGFSYSLVTVKGNLTVKNMRSIAVKSKVTKCIIGEVEEAGDGQLTKSAEALSGVNSRSELSWEFELAPGAERTIEFTYSVYVS